MLTLTEVRYWFYHISEEKQKEVQKSIGIEIITATDNSVFEQIRNVYADEIKQWYKE